MQYFVIHDLLAYKQHPFMIGCKLKKKRTRRKYRRVKQPLFKRLTKGDKLVYYASGDKIIVGIFEVVSRFMEYITDKEWGEIFIHRIKEYKMPPKGFFLSLDLMLNDPKISFDMFPKKTFWHAYLQGKTVKPISKRDLQTFLNCISRREYLVLIRDYKLRITKWHKELLEMGNPLRYGKA